MKVSTPYRDDKNRSISFSFVGDIFVSTPYRDDKNF